MVKAPIIIFSRMARIRKTIMGVSWRLSLGAVVSLPYIDVAAFSTGAPFEDAPCQMLDKASQDALQSLQSPSSYRRHGLNRQHLGDHGLARDRLESADRSRPDCRPVPTDLWQENPGKPGTNPTNLPVAVDEAAIQELLCKFAALVSRGCRSAKMA